MRQQPPVLDRQRRSLSIPRRLMPSVLALHTGSRPALNLAAELRAGGIMAAGRLDPLVTVLVEVMTDPTLVVSSEVSMAQGAKLARPRLTTFWRSGSRAVVGQTDDHNRFQLLQVEPLLLPFHIAQAVGAKPRPQPRFAGSCSIPAATLNSVERLIATNPSGAEDELSVAGVSPEWVDRILAALVMRRSLWSIESVWLGTNTGRQESRLAAIDAGFAGYFRIANGPDDAVVISPTSFDELLRRLAALLP